MTLANNSTTQTAAQILYQRRANATLGERLPEICRPVTVEQAWAIQNEISNLWCEAQDDSIGGWKCGMPSPEKIVV
ncbi:MAG: hydratase, partial [Moraxellaceae bacterium]